MKNDNKAIVIITHKLNEVMALSDKVAVLRKGKYIGTVNTAETTKEELSRMMVGRDVKFKVDKTDATPGETVLKVENLTVGAHLHKKDAVKNVSFSVRRGEIVCVAGIDGNGQTELVQAITGLAPTKAGRITLRGKAHRKVDWVKWD